MKHVLRGLVRLYQITTDWMPHTCIYTPTCSNYMLQALKEWGAIRGTVLGIRRILRCVPWKRGGLDPVPPNPKGKMKWLF